MKTLHKLTESFEFEKALSDESELDSGLRLILKKVAYITGYSGLDEEAKSILDFRVKRSPKIGVLLQLAKFNYLAVLEKKREELENVSNEHFILFKKPFHPKDKKPEDQSPGAESEKLAAVDKSSSEMIRGEDQKRSPYFSSTIIKKESKSGLKGDASVEVYADGPELNVRFNALVKSSIRAVELVFLDQEEMEKLIFSYQPDTDGLISETKQLPPIDPKQIHTIGIKLISE